jgi:hypothetical protein
MRIFPKKNEHFFNPSTYTIKIPISGKTALPRREHIQEQSGSGKRMHNNHLPMSFSRKKKNQFPYENDSKTVNTFFNPSTYMHKNINMRKNRFIIKRTKQEKKQHQQTDT